MPDGESEGATMPRYLILSPDSVSSVGDGELKQDGRKDED